MNGIGIGAVINESLFVRTVAAGIGGATIACPQTSWANIAAQYDVDRAITNPENAYWGVMAAPVERTYIERVRFVNRMNVVYARDANRAPCSRAIFSRLVCPWHRRSDVLPAKLLSPVTEAPQNLIVNYKRLTAAMRSCA